ncbi:hypothetical protein SAMD00019534_069150 [Acytostelium subglobosum LB1]|uniref:hypothetical protein n=1 Tax=Acytostelium subglobosum LB1 TaxID=1410327 RepID=UPI0006449FB3|nr:hypothetical protein SAMD00019534_069150 [Acytostelium subglobosum LB1]GAM23740.1 hypothetical protein SAMD00019534_069150 [Acytostelium subglobosum LB1]|eukprot:XP_012753481.1 hypothetical protein SAMD00019534_069150 [Acytostelium subglobosum LB1]
MLAMFLSACLGSSTNNNNNNIPISSATSPTTTGSERLLAKELSATSVVSSIILLAILKYYIDILRHFKSPSSLASPSSSSSSSTSTSTNMSTTKSSNMDQSNEPCGAHSGGNTNTASPVPEVHDNGQQIDTIIPTNYKQSHIVQQRFGNSMITGNGINGTVGTVGDDITFNVVSYDHVGNRRTVGGDNVQVRIQARDINSLDDHGGALPIARVEDCSNGIYHVTYNVSRSGNYSINVEVNHVPIRGSPFSVYLVPVQYQVQQEHTITTTIMAGQEFSFNATPLRQPLHPIINDTLEIDTYITENGTTKKINNNDFTAVPLASTGYTCRGKLIRCGDYTIEGTINGIVVLSKRITVQPALMSAKYSLLQWDGKELITENKLFFLDDSCSPASEMKLLVLVKDQFGNKSRGCINDLSVEAHRSLSPYTNNHYNGGDESLDNTQEQLKPLLEVHSRGIAVRLPAHSNGRYNISIKHQGEHIVNSPFSLIAVKQSEYNQVSAKHQQGQASFQCKVEKNNKLTNVYLNITTTVILTSESEILIKDTKNKVHLKDCNAFLILLTTTHFFGEQSEPTFDSKVKWLKTRLNKLHPTSKATPLKLHISSRDNILEESIEFFQSVDPKSLVLSRLVIKFLNEDGVDIGGISKEWFAKISEEIGSKTLSGYPLFEGYDSNRQFHPSPFSNMIPNYRAAFRTIGSLVAKSIYESIIKADRHLSIRFTPCFYKLLLNEPLSPSDMELVDPELYRNHIQYIQRTPIEQVNQAIGEPLYFTRTITHLDQTTRVVSERSINLKPFGNLIPVTDDTKQEYLDLLVTNIFSTSIRAQIDEFRDGFSQVIPLDLISIFNWKELDLLVCGKDHVDIDDLRLHSNVIGVICPEIIDNFWNILRSMDIVERKKLLSMAIQIAYLFHTPVSIG